MTTEVALGLLALVGLGWYALSGAPSAAYPRLQGTASRDEILRMYREAGLSENLAKAAAVNAYAESAWDSWAVGDSGASLGLFQLHEDGLGKDLKVPRLDNGRPNPADPRFSAQRNIERTIRAVKAEPGLVLAMHQASVAALVEQFCRRIERPANPDASVRRRIELIRTLFP